jgi:CheY-specific phosphatase CheX
MSNYRRYSLLIVRSVDHIFKNFLNDPKVEEVFEAQSSGKDSKVAIEIEGTLKGELVFNIPVKTLDLITKKMVPDLTSRSLRQYHRDVAGEIANLITGTFANQLQFLKHEVRLSPPEIDDDPISLKALYDNINLSFRSSFGGFDVDLYYRENK